MAASKRLIAILRDERGGPMLEFALILPFATIIIFGIIQYGLIFAAFISLRDAAWSVARYAMTIPGAPSAANAKNIATVSLAGVLSPADLDNPFCEEKEYVAGAGIMDRCILTYHYRTIFPVPGVGADGRFILRAEATTK